MLQDFEENAWGEFLGGICWWISAAPFIGKYLGKMCLQIFTQNSPKIHPEIHPGKTRSPEAKNPTLWHTP